MYEAWCHCFTFLDRLSWTLASSSHIKYEDMLYSLWVSVNLLFELVNFWITLPRGVLVFEKLFDLKAWGNILVIIKAMLEAIDFLLQV